MPVFDRLKKKLRERKCESPIEEMVCECLRRLNVPFRIQEPIGPFFADIFIPDLNLVIECDGAAYHQDKEKEARRDDFIRKAGYEIVHYTGSEIYREDFTIVWSIVKGPSGHGRIIRRELDYCPLRQDWVETDGDFAPMTRISDLFSAPPPDPERSEDVINQF